MAHRTLFPPPDEKRALEQLERFHREILRARRDRERAGAEFEGFVQGLRDQGEGKPGEAPPASRRAPRAVVPASEQPAQAPVGVVPATPAALPAPFSPERPAAATAPAAETREPIPALAAPTRGARRGLFLGAALVLLAAAVGALYYWQRSQQQTTTGAAGSATPSAAVTPAQPPSATPAPPAAPPPQPAAPAPTVLPSTVQMATDRAVWMRVIVDGQKILERELPAGQHLTYTPTRSIVIRAGDGGAVRVKVGNGAEEVMGRDAFPVTRRFDVPPKP